MMRTKPSKAPLLAHSPLAQAALLSTQVAIARWRAGGLSPVDMEGARQLRAKADWHAQVEKDLHDWILHGGFGARAPAAATQNENDGIAPSFPRPAWDTL